MARSTIVTVAVGRDTLEPAGTALPADGGQFQHYSPHGVLKLKNVGIAARTATLVSRYTGHDRSIAVAAGATRYVRADSQHFVQADGNLYVNVDAATDVQAMYLAPAKDDMGV